MLIYLDGLAASATDGEACSRLSLSPGVCYKVIVTAPAESVHTRYG